MIHDRLRVFVSSKMQELAAERAVIKEILAELNVDAWVFEQDAGARPETIEESYQEQLEASDLYIGVFWKGYGAYTIDEFELARNTETDCLIYQKGDADAEGRDPKLQAFLDRISRVETGLTVQWFETAEELREMVRRDVARWQTRIVRRYRQDGPRRIAGLPADPNLVVLRNKVKQFWVGGVLDRATSGTGLVELAKESRPDAVDRPPETTGEVPDERDAGIDPGTSAREVFERMRRSLLILGQPGAGKTTLALQLARDLIAKAERDDSQPVPVVLNLSAWSADSPTLTAWIASELSRKYHVPAWISRSWLEQNRLVLILDGLDEVAAERRAACVAAINRFNNEVGASGLVVTSRLEEYEALPARLRTHGAICLRPLERDQIDAYLEEAGEHLAGLRTALEKDEVLKELASSPLMLGVMSLAYQDRPVAELEASESESAEARRARLFGTYVERAFDQRKTAHSYSREATTSWLSWLARRMSERDQTLFLIEDLQPSWLATRAQLVTYLLGFAAVPGLVMGSLWVIFRWATAEPFKWPPLTAAEVFGWPVAVVVFLLGIGITDGLRFGRHPTEAQGAREISRRVAANLVTFGLLWVPIVPVMAYLMGDHFEQSFVGFVVLIFLPVASTMGCTALGARRSVSRSIKTTESLGLERTSAGRGALLGLLAGAVLAMFLGTKLALVFWCLLGSGYGAVVGGYRPHLVRGKTVPNQGMRLTRRMALRGAVMAVPLAAIVPLFLLATVEYRPEYRDLELVAKWSITALISFFVHFAGWFGALDLCKHYLVRAVIGATRQGPWDFPHLLNDASGRNLMRRVGGGYMFVHRPLLDHFANLDLPPPDADEVHDSERQHTASSALVIVAMVALALAGAVTLFATLEVNLAAAVVATVLLASGAMWLVIRAAVTSALRADRRGREGE